MRMTRTISCRVSCHVSRVTGGMEWQKVRPGSYRKNNSHSLILEKLSPRTSQEIESVDDEMSPTKCHRPPAKELSHFLGVCSWNDWTWTVRRKWGIALSYFSGCDENGRWVAGKCDFIYWELYMHFLWQASYSGSCHKYKWYSKLIIVQRWNFVIFLVKGTRL